MRRAALSAWLGLILLGLCWELWLAPSAYAPAAVWAVIKTVPLLLPLPGLRRGSFHAWFLATLLVLMYLLEAALVIYDRQPAGLVPGSPLACAWIEFLLASTFFMCATLEMRRLRAMGVVAL